MAKNKKVGLEVVVSATDKATAQFKEINKRFANSGLGKLNNSFRLLKGASGFNQLGKAVGNFGGAISNASSEFQSLLLRVGALAGLGGGGLFALSKGFSDFADTVQDGAERLDFSVEAYQKYSIGAQLAGMNTEKFNIFVNKFSRGLGDAITQGGQAAEVFKKLGISLKGKTNDQIFADVMLSLNKMPNAFKRNAAIAKIFGKNFGEITPYIKDFARYTQEAEGFIISKEDIARGDEFQDKLNVFSKILGSIRNVAGAAMLDGFTEGLKVLSDFLKENKAQIKEFFTAIGKELPAAFKFLTSALKAFMSFFSTLDPETGKMTLNMGRLKLVLGVIAAILAGPFIASIIAIGGAFIGIIGPAIPILAAISAEAYLIGAAFLWAASLVYRHWEPIKQLFLDIWGYIKSIKAAWGGVFSMENLRGISSKIMGPAPVAQRNFLQAPMSQTNNATASLNVNFSNMPKGAKVNQSSEGFESLLIERGYAF